MMVTDGAEMAETMLKYVAERPEIHAVVRDGVQHLVDMYSAGNDTIVREHMANVRSRDSNVKNVGLEIAHGLGHVAVHRESRALGVAGGQSFKYLGVLTEGVRLNLHDFGGLRAPR